MKRYLPILRYEFLCCYLIKITKYDDIVRLLSVESDFFRLIDLLLLLFVPSRYFWYNVSVLTLVVTSS